MKDFYIFLYMKDFYIFVNEGFLYFVEGFLYFEDMNEIESHFLFPIKEPFRAEQLPKNLIQ